MKNQISKKIQIKGLPFGLTIKSLFTPFILIASASVIFVYLLATISGYVQMQSVLETAGKQRILNQQFMKEVLISSKGVPTAHQSTAKQIMTSIDLLKRNTVETGRNLKANSEIEQIQNELDKQKSIFNSLSQASDAYLRSFDTKDQKSKVFEELHLHSLELQGAVDTTVATYDQHLQSGIPWWDVDAIAVELAERQKMLVQQHIKEVLFVASGIPNDYQSTRIKLFETLKLLTEGGEMSLSKGQKIIIPAPKTELLKETLNQQLIKLKQFIATSNQYLMLTNASVDQQLKVQQLLTLNENMHDSCTKTFVMYQSYLSNQVHEASRNCILAGILLAIFGLLLTWQFASHVLLKPLSKIKAALRRLGEGDTSVQINSVSRDEVGSVALQLNRSASKLHDKILSMHRWMEDGDYSHLKVASQHDKMGGAIRQWANDFKDKLSHVARTVSHSQEDFLSDGQSEPTLFVNVREPQPIRLKHHPLIEELTEGEVVGVAPDLNTFNENDMFGQLLNRANELKTQQKQLLVVNQELKEETISLNDSKQRLRSAEESLRNRNEELLRENYEKDEVFENQKRIISEMSAKLQDQADALRRSEVRLNAQSTELTTINSSLMMHATEHSQHVQLLEKTMKEKALTVHKAQEQINELRNQIASYQLEKDALEDSLNRVKDGLGVKDLELAEFQKMLETKEIALNEQNKEFTDQGDLDKNRLDTLKLIARKEAAAREALIEMSSKYDKITKLYESLKADSVQTISQKDTELLHLQNKFNSIKQNHDHEINALRSDYDTKLIRLQDSHRHALEQLVQSKSLDESQARVHYNRQIQALNSDRANEAALTKNEYEARISKLETSKTTEISHLKNEYEARISKLETSKTTEISHLKNEYGSKITQLESTHSYEVGQLKSDYEAHIKKLKEVQDAEIRTSENSNSQRIDTVTREHNSQIEQLKIAHQNSMSELQADYETQIENLKNGHSAHINQLTAEYETQVQTAKDELAALETNLDELNVANVKQIQQMAEAHLLEAQSMEEQFNKAILALEKANADENSRMQNDYTLELNRLKEFQGNSQAEAARIQRELQTQIDLLKEGQAKQLDEINQKQNELDQLKLAEGQFLESAARINGLQSELAKSSKSNLENKAAKEASEQKHLLAVQRIKQLEQELISSREVHEVWSNRLLQAETKLELANATVNSKSEQLKHIEAQFIKETEKTSLLRRTAEEESKEAFRQIELKEIEIASLNNKIQTTRDSLQAKELEVREKNREIERISSLYSKAQTESEEAFRQIELKEIEIESLNNKYQSSALELQETTQSLNHSSQRIEALQQDVQKHLLEIAKKASQLQPLEANLARLQNDLEACKANSLRKQESLRIAEERLTSTRQALKASIDELNEKSF